MDRETVTIDVADLMTFPSNFELKIEDFYLAQNKTKFILRKLFKLNFQF